MMGYYSYFGGFGFIFMILFWGLIIAGVYYAFRFFVNETNSSNGGGKALDILKERYAKGEINKKEFLQMKKDLSE